MELDIVFKKCNYMKKFNVQIIFTICLCGYVFTQSNNAYQQAREMAGNPNIYIPPVNGPVAVGEESSSSEYNSNAVIISSYINKAEEINNQGVYYHNSGNYNKAIKYYKKALWYNPYNETARENLKNAIEAKKIYRKNKKEAIRSYNKEKRILKKQEELFIAEQRKKEKDEEKEKKIYDSKIELKAKTDAEKAVNDLKEATQKLSELKSSLDNTNRYLKLYTQALVNNNSELDKWGQLADNTYKNTLNVSKEYFMNMFLKYSLLNNLDPQYRNGPYKKIQEFLNNNSEMNNWLKTELYSSNIDPDRIEKLVNLFLTTSDAAALESQIFFGTSNEVSKNLDAVLFINNLFDATGLVKYDKFKDLPMFKQMDKMKGVTSPADWFTQAKVVGEVYSDIIVQYYSWKNINELLNDNEEKSQKIDELITKQKYTISQINCLEECIKRPDGKCMNKCTGKTKLHTPPPPLK